MSNLVPFLSLPLGFLITRSEYLSIGIFDVFETILSPIDLLCKVILHDKPSDSSGPEYNQIQSKAWSEEDLLSV